MRPPAPSGTSRSEHRARTRFPGLRLAAAPVTAFHVVLRSLAEWGGVALGLCGLLLLWAGILHSLSTERDQAMSGAIQDTSNLARAFEETIIRSIKSVDHSLLSIRDSRQRDPDRFDIAAWTRNVQALTDMTFQISIIDREGIFLGSNLAPAGSRIDLSDREHFRVHRERPEDTLFISRPILGRASHRWSIQLTRKLLAADGSFDGVIVISLDPEYLSRFYNSVDLGRAGLVLLVGTDGIVRAGAGEGVAPSRGGQSQAGDEPTIGRSLLGTKLFDAYGRKPAGHFTATSAIDGLERVEAYREVRGLPLLVAVGVATDDVLQTHRSNQIVSIVVAGSISVMMLGAIWLVSVRQGRLARARRLLRASEAMHAEKSGLLETTLEHMSQGIMMVNAEGYVMVCNQHAMDAVGLPAELMAGRPHFDEVVRWQWEHGEFGSEGRDIDESVRAFVLSGGLSREAHAYERTRPNGRVLEIRSTPLAGGGLVRTYTDITESKQNESVLRAARDEADAAATAKSEFLATMSHEIRSPMSGLLGVLELLRETELDPEQARMARMVHGSAMGLLGVLNDILDFSKIEAGGVTICLEPASIVDLVNDVAQPHSLSAARKHVQLDVRCSPAVAGFAELDVLRVGQILNNLLSNAVKFTAAGSIFVTVGPVQEDGAPMLGFSVADSGIGMEAAVLARLFNPFTQADGSTSRRYGGTGLGLCISRRLSSMLGGTLGVTSSPGVGSTFTLRLPWRPVAAPVAQPNAPAEVASPHGLSRAAVRGCVLVADDDATNRWLSQRLLGLLGFDVDVAEDGAEAFAMLCAKPYDLLLTDCHMPRMDGVALTQAVRASGEAGLRSLPIIGLTADVTPAQQRRCAEAGMTELAYKPLGRANLAAILSRMLEAASPASATTALIDPAGKRPAFDPAQFHDLFEPGDADGPAWLREYLEAAGGVCAGLTELLSGSMDEPGARAEMAALAHKLVGSSVSVGAAGLGALARALEHAADAAPRPALQEELAAVLAEFDAVRDQIIAFGERVGNVPPLEGVQADLEPALA